MSGFYPRSPCGERRHWQTGQSRTRRFYPRSPCGERRVVTAFRGSVDRFLSTLSLRRATGNVAVELHMSKFLSTLSLRRATGYLDNIEITQAVSIHALLAESDPPSARLFNGKECFYPRSPCGERQYPTAAPYAAPTFLSTLSLRRATGLIFFDLSLFLSTLSLRRATTHVIICAHEIAFLSTLSLRRATVHLALFDRAIHVSIHALLAESDSE